MIAVIEGEERLEQDVTQFAKRFMEGGAYDMAFADIITYEEDDILFEKQQMLRAFVELLNRTDNPEAASMVCRKLFNTVKPDDSMRLKLAFSLCCEAIDRKMINQRIVGEIVLSSPALTFENDSFWTLTFNFINDNIRKTDYKGVRDQLKLILDKCVNIPKSLSLSGNCRQLVDIKKVLMTILNRNNSLLPAYLILDEVIKKTNLHQTRFNSIICEFIDSFNPVAQMVSLVGRNKIMPIVGVSQTHPSFVWKLDPQSCKFMTRGLLPYPKEMTQPQHHLLLYVMCQPYSRDTIISMMDLGSKMKQKNFVPSLENTLVDMILLAIDRSENELTEDDLFGNDSDVSASLSLWQHISATLIYFVLFNHTNFNVMMTTLRYKLIGRTFKRSRHHLMWVFLQFISGAISKFSLHDFLHVMPLYDILYPETTPLPVPDVTKSGCTHVLAAASIWIHLIKKADEEGLGRPIPQALSLHFQFLTQDITKDDVFISCDNFRISLLCNAFSTNQDMFNKPMASLCPVSTGDTPLSTPLSMSFLDSLTIHTKMSLIHSMMMIIVKQSQNPSSPLLNHSMVETYSRLLVYTEIESLGIKCFFQQIIPKLQLNHNWNHFYPMIELFIFRIQHAGAHYRVELQKVLNSLMNGPSSSLISVSFHNLIEIASFKVLSGMKNQEILSIHQYNPSDLKTSFVSNESEEINKFVVLTLSRAIHVTNSETLSHVNQLCQTLLNEIHVQTPLTWSQATMSAFPPIIGDFYRLHPGITHKSKDYYDTEVEQEYMKWKNITNDQDKVTHFSHPSNHLFICVMYKLAVDMDSENGTFTFPPIVYSIIEMIGTKNMSKHIRVFADYFVNKTSASSGGNLKKRIDTLNDLIWKHHMMTLDRFMFTLAFRSFEGNQNKVALLMMILLLEKDDLKSRMADFLKENIPDHWKVQNWNHRNNTFHTKYPEKHFSNFLPSTSTPNSSTPSITPYFSNVLMRLLPVLDILIHRTIEHRGLWVQLEHLFNSISSMYMFHEQPITYLYNTLHFYETILRGNRSPRLKFVSTVVGAFKDHRPENWALTKDFQNYMSLPSPQADCWTPDGDYYSKLVQRLVDTQYGKSPFPQMDWRFNEFPNVACHALHITCVELMALPVTPAKVTQSLMQSCLSRTVPKEHRERWMSCTGLIITSLPNAYYTIVLEKLIETLDHPSLTTPGVLMDPFKSMDFYSSFMRAEDVYFSNFITLIHNVWHHASIGQITDMPTIINEQIKPHIKTEEQFLFLCHCVGPFLQRFYFERTRVVMDMTISLYELLLIIDRNFTTLRFIDPICDLMYHIKYQFTGDSVRVELENIIKQMKPETQLKLRFITPLSSP